MSRGKLNIETMTKIPQEYIEKVMDLFSLESLVGSYVKLRPRNGLMWGLCPFHNEKTPSFAVYPKSSRYPRGSFHCFGCGRGGKNPIDFLLLMNMDFRSAVKTLAHDAGIPFPYEEGSDEVRIDSTVDTKPLQKPYRNVPPEPQPEYLPMKRIESSARIADRSNLFRYLVNRFPRYLEVIRKVFWDYRIGCSQSYQLNGCNACSTFPMIDEKGNCHRLKIIPYPLDNHHRIKSLDKKGDIIQRSGKGTKLIYFGSHLLNRYPNKPIALVESEKTALVGQIFFDKFLWIATGGKGNLKHHHASFMKGRILNLFPDVDGLMDDNKGVSWIKAADELRADGHTVLIADSLLRQCDPNGKDDICDIILSTFNEPIVTLDSTVSSTSTSEIIPKVEDPGPMPTPGTPEFSEWASQLADWICSRKKGDPE